MTTRATKSSRKVLGYGWVSGWDTSNLSKGTIKGWTELASWFIRSREKIVLQRLTGNYDRNCQLIVIYDDYSYEMRS